MKNITVVMPAYNEADSIGNVIREIKNKIKGIKIIVVNDGSTDRTAEIARKSGATVISHPCNKGYGAALKTGAKRVTTDFVLYFDADGQFYVDDMKKLISEVDRYDMVIGARPKEMTVKDMGRRLMKITASYLSGNKIPDLNSGFRLIRKQRIMDFIHILPNGFSFTTTITLAMMQAGDSVKFTSVRVKPRKTGKSGIKSGRHFMKFMLYILRMIMLFNPLKVFLPISAAMFAVGFPIFLFYLITALHISQTSLMIMLFALLTFLFGLVADVVSMMVRK